MKTLQVPDPALAARQIAEIVDTLERGDDTNLKGLIEIDQLLPGNPQSIMTDLAEDIYRTSLTMSIKTLPIFHISNIHHMNSPCIVFAQDAPIKQSLDTERTLLNSFFSGLYLVVGFKHTISTKSATSEFSLVKNDANFSVKNKEDAE